ncbi:LysR family transcriptional regulator [Oenococcus sp. UCMA 16435]|nr:LysR family transcriptional regulator [Oenococcus sp. UCMA 16435]MDN6967893.1 LysR family transcriptional regulator [Oenococcus sp. UCMA 17063]
MKFTDIEYFDKISELESFSKTAIFFNVSQPTISFAVQRLESEMKKTLINRNRSHGEISLTDAGQIFEKHAKKILQEVVAAHEEIDRINWPTIEFGLPQIIGNYYFPKLVKHFVGNPFFQNVATHEAGSDLLLKALKNHRLDLAIISSVNPVKIEGLETIEIDRKKYLIVVSKDNPLAKQKEISFEDLVNEKFVSLKEGNVHPIAFRQLEETYNVYPKIIYETPDVNILKKMIAEKTGIGFIVEIAVDKQDNLATLQLKNKRVPEFIISFVYKKDLQIPGIKNIVEELRNNSIFDQNQETKH